MRTLSMGKILFYVLFFGLLSLLIFGLGPFFAPMLFALLLAFIFYPAVGWLMRRGVGRKTSCFLITVFILFTLTALFVILVPLVGKEVENLKEKLPEIGRALREWFVDLPVYENYSQKIRQFDIQNLYERIPSTLQAMAKTAFQSADGFFKFLVRFVSFFVFPLFTYYFLAKAEAIRMYFIDATPPRWRRPVRDFFDFVNQTFSLYFRGQVIVACVLAVLYIIGFLLAGFPSPFLVGALSGILNIIPYFGTGLGIALAMLILLSQFSLALLLKTLAVFLVVQMLESYFITPRVVGRSVNVPFFQALIAIVVGGNLAGIWGVVLAMPATAILLYLLEKNRPWPT